MKTVKVVDVFDVSVHINIEHITHVEIATNSDKILYMSNGIKIRIKDSVWDTSMKDHFEK